MKDILNEYTVGALLEIAIDKGLELPMTSGGKVKDSKKVIIEKMLAFGIEVDAKVEEKKESETVVFSRPLPMSNRQKTRRS